MTPTSVREATHDCHKVLIETNAGLAIGLTDDDYRNAQTLIDLIATACANNYVGNDDCTDQHSISLGAGLL